MINLQELFVLLMEVSHISSTLNNKASDRMASQLTGLLTGSYRSKHRCPQWWQLLIWELANLYSPLFCSLWRNILAPVPQVSPFLEFDLIRWLCSSNPICMYGPESLVHEGISHCLSSLMPNSSELLWQRFSVSKAFWVSHLTEAGKHVVFAKYSNPHSNAEVSIFRFITRLQKREQHLPVLFCPLSSLSNCPWADHSPSSVDLHLSDVTDVFETLWSYHNIIDYKSTIILNGSRWWGGAIKFAISHQRYIEYSTKDLYTERQIRRHIKCPKYRTKTHHQSWSRWVCLHRCTYP